MKLADLQKTAATTVKTRGGSKNVTGSSDASIYAVDTYCAGGIAFLVPFGYGPTMAATASTQADKPTFQLPMLPGAPIIAAGRLNQVASMSGLKLAAVEFGQQMLICRLPHANPGGGKQAFKSPEWQAEWLALAESDTWLTPADSLPVAKAVKTPRGVKSQATAEVEAVTVKGSTVKAQRPARVPAPKLAKVAKTAKTAS